MILEGVVTTCDADGRVNIAPMGGVVGEQGLASPQLTLRPWRGSRTYENLRDTGQGVFHVTDDVLLIARAAVSHVDDVPVCPIEHVSVPRLVECCRWRAFQVADADWSDHASVQTQVIAEGRVRDFFGLNRAKFAVLEATIEATRLHLTGPAPVLETIDCLRPLIDKTAGPAERRAFRLIEDHVRTAADRPSH